MTHSGPGADRRPWLIISRREGQALLACTPGEDLERAQHQLRIQIAWIDGKNGDQPNPTRALKREFTD